MKDQCDHITNCQSCKSLICSFCCEDCSGCHLELCKSCYNRHQTQCAQCEEKLCPTELINSLCPVCNMNV